MASNRGQPDAMFFDEKQYLFHHGLLCGTSQICVALRDLVPFVQFDKREKHPWRSVNFSKVAGCAQFGIICTI